MSAVPAKEFGADCDRAGRRFPNRGKTSTSCFSLPEGIATVAYGIDTVSFAYRGLDPHELRRIPEEPRFSPITGEIFPLKRLPREGWVLGDPMSGMKLGFTVDRQGRWLLWSEARLAALLAGDEKDVSLASPADLENGEWRARNAAAGMGVVIPDEVEATARRCDLAADVVFASMKEAQSFLLGLSTMNLRRWKRTVISAPGSSALESVSWSTGAGIQLRIYDKTEQAKRTKHGRAGRSIDCATRTIRLERQFRPKKARQLGAAAFAAQDLSALFAGPLAAAEVEPALAATLDPVIALWRNHDTSGELQHD